MAFTYVYDPKANIIHTKVTDVVRVKDILKYVQSIVIDKSIKKGFIEIVDSSMVDDIIISYAELEPFKAIWNSYIEKGCRATIIFAPTDLSYGSFRMLQTVLELSQETDEERFIVLKSKEEVDRMVNQFLP